MPRRGASSRRSAAAVDVGPAGARQGHRVGDRRDGVARRCAAPSELPHRRHDSSEGAGQRGRGVSGDAGDPKLAEWRVPVSGVRRLLSRAAGAHADDPGGGSRGTPVRLRRPSHVRRPRRRSRLWPSRRRDRLSPRDRAAAAAAPGSSCPNATRRRSPMWCEASSTIPSCSIAWRAECRRLAPDMSWLAVARRYAELADSLAVAERASA